MWGASEESPGTMERGSPEAMSHAMETCEQNKNQLEIMKEIMMKNKQSLKKKEEEVQEYARKISKIKSRAKLSRRSKDGSSSSKDSMESPRADTTLSEVLEESVDDISQARTPKAKSSLLQRKLAENRKAFEQRNKEITESKRAVEEKVEAIRQQLEEKDISVTPIKPVMIVSDVMSPIQVGNIQEKEKKIVELNNKILELEATILDLQENLKEKDSVIESKTKAVTLMSADLSKKGKTTLDTLEDTKDEMRTMQENFVLLETSLKNKNENLLDQLHERDNRISELEESVKRYDEQMKEQKLAETASVDFSRSTMDTLAETKDAMKSMQENFVLIESSLKLKNDNLLQQLQDYEIKLAEANERIFQLESGAGIVRTPGIEELQYKVEKLEHSNRQLEDEKYELQKSIAEMQDKIIANKSMHGDGALMEKDNRIAELESLIDELERSNELLKEESKTELQKQLTESSLKNEEYFNRIIDLEKTVHDLEMEKSNSASRQPDETAVTEESEKALKLTKELDELNKTMIKMKAQHRSKMKNLQKQLENFKMVSDTNAELVKLGNQVALLEEEKASAGDWQERIADLENKVSTQTKEIQMHIDAIATLENQKLDLMQELHTAKQEVSALEAENAESENLRVTAEMKVVDLEEQLESLHKAQTETKLESLAPTNHEELLKRIEALTQENTELYNKLSKIEEKGTSDSGSTESFEAIQETDRNDLLKKLEYLSQRNNELTLKLTKLEEKGGSNAGSTESFETINDTDKNELLKKIDQLTQENNDLIMKLHRVEEKGSSDTGSTESFERIPEHNESVTKIELLTQENSDLVIKLTKLEEQMVVLKSKFETSKLEESKDSIQEGLQTDALVRENTQLSSELSNLRSQMTEETADLQKRIETLIADNNELIEKQTKLEEHIVQLETDISQRSKRAVNIEEEIQVLTEEKNTLEKELTGLRETLSDVEIKNSRTEELLKENAEVVIRATKLEELNKDLKEDLNKVIREKDEIQVKLEEMTADGFARERLELIDKLEKLNQEKESVSQERQELQGQISSLLHKSTEESPETTRKAEEEIIQETESKVVASLEEDIAKYKNLIAEQEGFIEEMKLKLTSKEEELERKNRELTEFETRTARIEELEQELKETLNTVEEWRFKCNDMQKNMDILEEEKASIEKRFNMLQDENNHLLEMSSQKEAEVNIMKQQLETTVSALESKLEAEVASASAKEQEIISLKEMIESKDQELHNKYTQLQNEMIAIDSLQDELNNSKIHLDQRDALITSLSAEIEILSNTIRTRDEENYSLQKENMDLQEKLQESRPSKEYDELLKTLRDKDTILNDVQNKIEEITGERDDLLAKIENMSQRDRDVRSQLNLKEEEINELNITVDRLNVQIGDIEKVKIQTEKRVWELQGMLDNNEKYNDELQVELRNTYKLIEQLKGKHMEDMDMQNRRLQDTIEELNAKLHENDILKTELEEKERLVGQNVTMEAKISLEAKIADLEQKLGDSENKIHGQLEKMKKIAATLKKKTAICQELENRVAELEEKWTTEKDEKESKNKKIQEVESLIREKDNKIADLEEKLAEARKVTAEASTHVEKLTLELNTAKQKMSSLMEQITEMGEEIERLRTEIEQNSADLAAEKSAKEKALSDYESYKLEVIKKNEEQQVVLDEAKENARELSVRMQVMETEYVEQLGQIKHLKTENGLLLSKQTQINEKLENVEKESEERQALIERLQNEIGRINEVKTSFAETQTSEDEYSKEQDTRMFDTTQHSDHCEQCQTLVQALEAKLQEREAEIENLNNELANSISNFLQMRESLRYNDLINQSSVRDRSLEDPYNELLLQYNALTASNEDIKVKLGDTLKENNELAEKIESLQSLNETLKETVASVEQELTENKGATEKLQNVDSLYADLLKKSEEQQKELKEMEQSILSAREHADQSEQRLNSHIAQLESETRDLNERYMSLVDLKVSLEKEAETLRAERNEIRQRAADLQNELEIQSQKNMENKTVTSVTGETFATDAFTVQKDKNDGSPQLFDASKIFGVTSVSDFASTQHDETSRLQSLLNEKEIHCSRLAHDLDELNREITEERSQMMQNYNCCVKELKIAEEKLHKAEAEIEGLQTVLSERDKYIDTLNVELNSVGSRLKDQTDRYNETNTKLQELTAIRNEEAEMLKSELNGTQEDIQSLRMERDQQARLIESYKLQIISLEGEIHNSVDNDLVQDLQRRISAAVTEKELLQLQVNDLTRYSEELKELVGSQRNYQVEIQNALRERDAARETIANLTRALEETQKTAATVEATIQPTTVQLTETSKTEERNQQSGLDVGSSWDTGSNEKLNIDEETWGWNEEAAQLAGDHHLTTANIIPSEEVQLRAKVDELQDKIKDLEADKSRLAEENKNAQIRSGKLIKKLKEYKIQLDSLQQQLKIQKSAGGFCELDSAIEEELKSQIVGLENSLKQLRDEHKELSGEKEALLKRLDVLVSANERYMEMKERQDMDVEVLRIQNKELSNKVQTLQWRLQDNVTNIEEATTAQASDQNDSPRQEMEQPILHGQPRKRSIEETDDFKSLCKKYKEEIDDLKEGMEALATENEQLQFFLEELKRKAQNAEPKESAEIKEFVQSLDEANKRNLELQGMLNKSREEYDSLRKQYEQSLMDANDQVSVMRQNSDLLKAEVTEKTTKLEGEINDLHRQVEESNVKSNELEIKLQIAIDEKSSLEEKLKTLTSTEEKLSSVNITLSEVTDLLNSRVQEVADLKQELQRQYVDRQEAEDKLQTIIQQLTTETNEKRQELDSLKQVLNSKENELMQQKSVDTVTSIVSQATQELVQKHAIEIENKDKEIRELTDKLAMLQSAMNEYFLELLTKTGNIEHQQEEISTLQRNLTEKDSALESVKSELTSAKEDLTRHQTELTRREAELQELSARVQMYSAEIDGLQRKLNESESISTNLHQHTITIVDLEKQIETLTAVIPEKDLIIQRFQEELAEYKTMLENSRIEFDRLRVEREQIDVMTKELQNKTEQISYLESELARERNALEETKQILSEREALLEITSQKLDDSQAQLQRLSSFSHSEQQQSRNTPGIVDGLPLFRMGGNDDQNLQGVIDQLKHEMEVKQQEIDQLKYVLSENTYPMIIQQMQDSINCLYDEKNHLEASLRTATQTVAEKEKELESLRQHVAVQQKEIKEEASRDRRSIQDQEEILRLQNELHAKEQEINDLKYIIAEKDSQLSLQASMEPQSDDFELRQAVERLTNELYIKEQELQHLRLKIEELESEVLRLQNVERLSEESKEAIHRLTSEKEHIRQEAEEFLERKLREKEFEINEIKERLSFENEKLLNDLHLKNKNLEDLNKQLEESTATWTQRIREKEEELLHATTDLAEKERRLAELSITKDAELHNLKVQIHEKEVRIEELLALSEEEEKQLVELRESLTARETEINTLKELLENKVKEYEVIQNALRKDVPVVDMSPQSSEPTSSEEVQERNSNELDIALYMLHQRDVRCEELTHELMQLLEERDTLQLRLSNAIRVNEDLRKMAPADFSPKKDLTSSPGESEPLVEHPSPSKSEGPVEIAKEAIDSPIGEDKEALALKLSQLHNVDHARDVRLRDDRELRHAQQMSLLAHKDVLSTLPPEAAAKLVNANYTLSRDVQSQSSVLMNWLWGKSTPKVVHM